MSFHLKNTLDLPVRCFDIAKPKNAAKIVQAGQKVRSILANVEPKQPSQFDLDATLKKLLRIVNGQASLQDLKLREVREASWLVFQYQEESKILLFEQEPFFSNYLKVLRSQRTPRTTVSLVLSFLENYPVSSPRFHAICLSLGQLLERARRSARCEEIVKAVKKYELLAPNGPAKIAEAISQRNRPLREVMESALLTDIRASFGIIERVFEQYSTWTKSNLLRSQSAKGEISRYLEFAVNDEGERLRFPEKRTLLASTLLLPFENKNPVRETQAILQAFLLKHFGDPRTEPARWIGVPDNVRAVLRRWLVTQTFEDFFRIVDLSQQLDADADRQWKYRKAFWRAYFNKGVIEDAWLVLGADVQWQAKRRLGIDPKNYGAFRWASGAKKTHAALILKINSYVFTEWSHMGMWRMWHESDQKAPKFHMRQYTRHDLVNNATEEASHFSADSGGWQRKLSLIIRDRTGVFITRKDYMAGV